MLKKINVMILGSGNIGTDLLVKVLRSPYMNCTRFIGRNFSSTGMRKASTLGVAISDQSINAIINNPDCCELVFDATSASYHKKYAPIFKRMGIKAIDMTPSQVGKMCVPAINTIECLGFDNVNMITCGGQASIPIAYAITQVQQDIEYIEVVSSISSRSAGPGTRANIDEYIENTESGLKEITGCKNVKAIINLNPAVPCIDMQASVCVKVKKPDMKNISKSVSNIAEKMKKYVPGYKVIIDPVYENGRIIVMVKVRGLGDFLPQYAGNLDIINCAAISIAEEYAKLKLEK
ncbi:MAG: acetaldehyde dehydrogenase (acetylating) [Desulfobacterales bacterium]|nr:acetaldehyde dehydrogenase (acetylating) [Desulfobacterales bacterium]